MSTENQEDLSLLLSLQDRVLETPPSSSSSSTRPASLGYLSDDELPRRRSGNVDLSAFKAAVEDCMDYDVETAKKALKSNKLHNPTNLDVEKFSGLRIRNQLVSPAELSNHFSDIRFVRLSTIKNLIKGDTLSGCWATVGVLTEKGSPKTSSTGKNYCIWKIGCLDGQSITIFLFGDAYKKHSKEPASTVFAFFNAGVRKDALGPGFQLSVFNSNQILKIGTSIDYGVCKGKRKDGLPCTMVIDKNLRTAFRSQHQPEGIYMVDPLADRSNIMKPKKTTKLLSVDGLKKALSQCGSKNYKERKHSEKQCQQQLEKLTSTVRTFFRSMSTVKSDLSGALRSQLRDSKRMRTEPGQVSAQRISMTPENVIELDYVSSDEDSMKANFILGK
ncbi:hypothetical protein Cgig2_003150 [Carnegiea gigantea]|uniref:Protein MCM10 homolog n=1 Tax=Carnegiea gigantea TaxID=171969 RepID=A0A9Q1JM96_9CARY|nr:hypothetical protein Cgig2_003150 [Carnegiea gigantea]